MSWNTSLSYILTAWGSLIYIFERLFWILLAFSVNIINLDGFGYMGAEGNNQNNQPLNAYSSNMSSQPQNYELGSQMYKNIQKQAEAGGVPIMTNPLTAKQRRTLERQVGYCI